MKTKKYYHIVTEAQSTDKGRIAHLISLDNTEEQVRKLVESLTKKKELLFKAEDIHPQIHKVSLFRSTKPTAELVLPNGKSIADYKNSECKPVGCCKHRYIARCMSRGKVKDVNDCTNEFMPSKRSRNRHRNT